MTPGQPVFGSAALQSFLGPSDATTSNESNSLAGGRSAVSLSAARLPHETQVAVAEQDDRAPRRPLTFLSQWTVAWIGIAVAVPIALWALVPMSRPTFGTGGYFGAMIVGRTG